MGERILGLAPSYFGLKQFEKKADAKKRGKEGGHQGHYRNQSVDRRLGRIFKKRKS